MKKAKCGGKTVQVPEAKGFLSSNYIQEVRNTTNKFIKNHPDESMITKTNQRSMDLCVVKELIKQPIQQSGCMNNRGRIITIHVTIIDHKE